MTKQITNNKTVDKRNPPPLTVSFAPSGDEGPTVYIQTNERKSNPNNKNNLFHVQIIIPVGCHHDVRSSIECVCIYLYLR
jgi:hypothetical protein